MSVGPPPAWEEEPFCGRRGGDGGSWFWAGTEPESDELIASSVPVTFQSRGNPRPLLPGADTFADCCNCGGGKLESDDASDALVGDAGCEPGAGMCGE